jgi:arylsulfatase A-like enzyme
MFNVLNHFSWRKVDSTAPVDCSMDPPIVTEWTSTVTRQDAIAWISGLPSQDPFFAYVAFNVPHEPLQVPPFGLLKAGTVSTITTLINPVTGMPYAEGDPPGTPEDRNCGSPMYPDQFGRHVQVLNWMIEAVDTEIGMLLAALNSLGRLDDTVIFVVGDNGTSRRALDCPLNPEHGKVSLYQLGARVPLIVWGPRVVAAQHQGSSCAELISVVDLWTTIAEITEGRTGSRPPPSFSVPPFMLPTTGMFISSGSIHRRQTTTRRSSSK